MQSYEIFSLCTPKKTNLNFDVSYSRSNDEVFSVSFSLNSFHDSHVLRIYIFLYFKFFISLFLVYESFYYGTVPTTLHGFCWMLFWMYLTIQFALQLISQQLLHQLLPIPYYTYTKNHHETDGMRRRHDFGKIKRKKIVENKKAYEAFEDSKYTVHKKYTRAAARRGVACCFVTNCLRTMQMLFPLHLDNTMHLHHEQHVHYYHYHLLHHVILLHHHIIKNLW